MHLKLVRGSKDTFTLLEEMADKVDDGAQELLALLVSFDRVEDQVQWDPDIKNEGDEIAQGVVREIKTSYVAPPDRVYIYRLASTLDAVLNDIEAAAERLTLFPMKEPLPQMVSLAGILAQATRSTARAMPNLRHLKTKTGCLHEYVSNVHALEDEGGRMYRRTKAFLYDGAFNSMDVLRYEVILKSIEDAIHRLEAVARTTEVIVTKSS